MYLPSNGATANVEISIYERSSQTAIDSRKIPTDHHIYQFGVWGRAQKFIFSPTILLLFPDGMENMYNQFLANYSTNSRFLYIMIKVLGIYKEVCGMSGGCRAT